MKTRLIEGPTYRAAVRNAGIDIATDPRNYLSAVLHRVNGNKVFFRSYKNEVEYNEFVFDRTFLRNIEFLYATTGREE